MFPEYVQHHSQYEHTHTVHSVHSDLPSRAHVDFMCKYVGEDLRQNLTTYAHHITTDSQMHRQRIVISQTPLSIIVQN